MEMLHGIVLVIVDMAQRMQRDPCRVTVLRMAAHDALLRHHALEEEQSSRLAEQLRHPPLQRRDSAALAVEIGVEPSVYSERAMSAKAVAGSQWRWRERLLRAVRRSFVSTCVGI
jgi:hypothetical protein